MTTHVVMRVNDVEPARRRLVLALGRGKSGKTLWSRWLVEKMRAEGVNPVVGDADGDTSCGVGRNDVEAVIRKGGIPVQSWWVRLTHDQASLRERPVVVDFSPSSSWLREVVAMSEDFAARHAAMGFDVTKVFFFGPDVVDAGWFGGLGSWFEATTTLLVFNEGSCTSRRPDRFDEVLAHPAVQAAMDKGAALVRMPELRLVEKCPGEFDAFGPIADGEEAVEGVTSFERHAVGTWLAGMDAAFGPFRAELGLR